MMIFYWCEFLRLFLFVSINISLSGKEKKKHKKTPPYLYVQEYECSGFCGCPLGVVSDIISKNFSKLEFVFSIQCFNIKKKHYTTLI